MNKLLLVLVLFLTSCYGTYYSTCPLYNYNTTTHIIIKKPVIKPTHRPIVTRPNKPNITIKPNRNNVKPNRNKTNNKITIKRKRK